jgi:outer membrane immunogenic protein
MPGVREPTAAIKNMNRVAHVKKGLMAAIGLLSLAITPALAADLPAQPYAKTPVFVPAAYDWSGFYLGLNGGGGSSRECWTINSSAGAAVAPNSEGCHNATGGMVGGQMGYRFQSYGWVYGVELQGDWADLKGTNPSLTAIIPYTNQTKIDAVGLLTGQVGYAFNNILLYVKGGAALVDDRFSSFFTGGGAVFNTDHETRVGGTVGVGAEFSFAPDWSVAFEYDHLFMGNPNVTFAPTPFGVGRTDNISQNVDIGLIKLNYRYGGPVIAKY